MLKRLLLFCAAVCLVVSVSPVLRAQQGDPTVFTFVASWNVPREKWADFEANAEKNIRPAFERFVANGTVLEWAISSRIVHEDGGPTHSTWWVGTSLAALEKAREELIQLPNPAAAGAGHSDSLLQSLVYRSRSSSVTSGYLYVSRVKVKPGMEQEWQALGQKYFHPVLDGLLKDGTLLGYGIDVEYVHTEDMSWRSLWYLTPTAEAQDKVRVATEAVFERNAATLLPALEATTVRSEHRDGFWRVKSYQHK